MQWLPLRSAAFQHGPLSDTSEPAPTRTTKHPYYDTTPNSSRESPNPRPRCGERLPTWRHHGRICRCPYTRATPAGAARLTTTGALTGTSRPLRSDRTTSGVGTKQGAGGDPGRGGGERDGSPSCGTTARRRASADAIDQAHGRRPRSMQQARPGSLG